MKPFTGQGKLTISLNDRTTINYHIGSVEKCFNRSSDEHLNPHYKLWERINSYLRRRGFNVTLDPQIEEDYKGLSKGHRYGIKKQLEFKTHRYPTGFEYKFFQNINFENQYGGEHDFDKYEKMPYMVKLSYRNEMIRLADFARSIGVNVIIEKKLTDIEAIIKSNNDNLHVHGRIESLDDLKGVMKKYDLSCNSTDANKKQIICGDMKCFYDYNKHIAIGKAYHNINNMWWVIVNGKRYNKASFELFDPYPEMPKRKPLKYEEFIQRLHTELRKFEEKKDYERCIQLRNYIRKINTGKLYRVWSVRHGCWWAGNDAGYTNDESKAGVYTQDAIEKKSVIL